MFTFRSAIVGLFGVAGLIKKFCRGRPKLFWQSTLTHPVTECQFVSQTKFVTGIDLQIVLINLLKTVIYCSTNVRIFRFLFNVTTNKLLD